MINVLIVEDDPMVSQVNRMYLNEIDGFNLQGAASSVKEAMKFIKDMDVDLILLDIYMPEGDGFTLLTYIRQKQIDIDVIVISAASDTKSIHRALQNGATDYIIKPFQFDRFKNALVTFRERKKVVSQRESLSQEQLDQLLLDLRETTSESVLPKGLTKNTLEQIINYIGSLDTDGFSTEVLADGVGISRISIRKYLAFLEKIDVLTTYISYGNIGRPLTMYKYVAKNERNVEPYLK
ncbi:response regulator [Oceanobacillus saliphilus]|uniref:response regulator n=1 Tax=Oceanobacillus saliphilus TaxID=2925834 RepID=UPI00201D9911|nr:response regulator [Oceanobacillus saliphilus]